MRLKLGQGECGYINDGDEVWNEGVTSCALVLAFCSDKSVAAFHWPGLVTGGSHDVTFGKLIAPKTVLKIEIFINNPPSSARQNYIDDAAAISKKFKSPTRLFAFSESPYMHCANLSKGEISFFVPMEQPAQIWSSSNS